VIEPLEGLAFAQAMRDIPLLYAAVAIAHIAGLAVLVGAALLFDLRLLGLSRGISVRALWRHLMPWSMAALLVIVPTGLAMFAANAGDLIESRVFQVKMALLLTAGMNAAIFHTGPYQSVASWDTRACAPWGARLCAALSMVLWLSIIACGRLLSYSG
jgi:hypothetical protein